MQIFHIARVDDWTAARSAGTYTISTAGRTLAQEGFIHASRSDQVSTVWEHFYSGSRQPLVLLTIETDKLTSPWSEDPVGEETYPHIHGPLNVSAVVNWQPMNAKGGIDTFLAVFVREVSLRALLALLVMVTTVVGGTIASRASDNSWSAALGALTGLVVGLVAVLLILRSRRAWQRR